MAILCGSIALLIVVLFFGWISHLISKRNKEKRNGNESEEFIVDANYINQYVSRYTTDVSNKKEIENEKNRTTTSRGTKRNKKDNK